MRGEGAGRKVEWIRCREEQGVQTKEDIWREQTGCVEEGGSRSG